MSISLESPEPLLSAGRRWIIPGTRSPNISQFTPYNLEKRTIAAVELFKEGFYPSLTKAAQAW
jgi:hypothetical protein